ncbi:MAG TPA: DinB family protein [Nocardia sp.]|uniref:DinB family protein n=1 Tax=Nocardia sp. TaxID=1821 RepID=UPI002B4B5F00|nr:DinB family protein [Nocardia sp.]HLS77274.1 DinB family protein [Nocardia sp.]
MNDTAIATPATLTGERAALLKALGMARFFLRNTLDGLTDEQAGARSTVSELCLGGLIKHVASCEEGWVNFVLDGSKIMKDFEDMTEADYAARDADFRMLPGDTVESVLARYAAVAARTDEIVATVDLDRSWPLPKAPWFQEESWTTREVLLHLIAETTQHSGHADIIREAIDGRKSMG